MTFVLTLSCPDAPGIVYDVSRFLMEQGGNVTRSQQFGDHEAGLFFMRVEFQSVSVDLTLAGLREDFVPVAASHSMEWKLSMSDEKQRVLILVSRFGHCLNDLLYRSSIRALNIEVVGVVSNHPDMEGMAANFAVPFWHIPVSSDSKPDSERDLLRLVTELRVDLVVLARYMQILSPSSARNSRAGQSTSITRSCPASRKLNPTSRLIDTA